MDTNITTTKPNGYTRGAWQGKMYDRDLSIKEIAERVKFFLKKQHPKCKFSVTTKTYRGGQSMDIALVQAPFTVFATPDINNLPRHGYGSDEQKLEYWNKTIASGHHQVNQFYIENDKYLNEQGRAIMQFAKNCATVYNFDDSDAQIDYFDTNFYLHLSIGKWNKPFIIK